MGDANDDLLRKAEQLKKRSEEARQDALRNQEDSTVGRVREHIQDIQEGVSVITGITAWVFSHIIKPVATHPWAGVPFRAYQRLWARIVHGPEKDGSRGPFSRRRATAMSLATLAFLWFLPGMLGSVLELCSDSFRMAVSYKKDEILYLGKSQEIDPEGNIFSAQGCESIQCTDQTSLYFRIKPSLANHIWSLIHNGNIFFPDYVAAGIQNDINKCKVTGYGMRWKLLVRNWDIYPQILSVSCVPVTEEEIKAAKKQDK